MARYRVDDKSERRTGVLTMKLAPSERAALEAAAGGVPLSTYARTMLFRESARRLRAGATRKRRGWRAS